ncbi:hypothetical protein SDC9_195744 [bioreactor metagenome]|uniref:Uncharacterized protein n=1 Tax=bioreactor metagenome TaxID=1076179 RepID=A0A645ICF8_9ZZZZ
MFRKDHFQRFYAICPAIEALFFERTTGHHIKQIQNHASAPFPFAALDGAPRNEAAAVGDAALADPDRQAVKNSKEKQHCQYKPGLPNKVVRPRIERRFALCPNRPTRAAQDDTHGAKKRKELVSRRIQPQKYRAARLIAQP